MNVKKKQEGLHLKKNARLFGALGLVFLILFSFLLANGKISAKENERVDQSAETQIKNQGTLNNLTSDISLQKSTELLQIQPRFPVVNLTWATVDNKGAYTYVSPAIVPKGWSLAFVSNTSSEAYSIGQALPSYSTLQSRLTAMLNQTYGVGKWKWTTFENGYSYFTWFTRDTLSGNAKVMWNGIPAVAPEYYQGLEFTAMTFTMAAVYQKSNPLSIKLKKTDESGAALANAHFQFQSKNSQGRWAAFNVLNESNDYVTGSDGTLTLPQAVLNAVEALGNNGENQAFRFVETKAPDGYMTPDGSSQFITAEKVLSKDSDGEQLFTLTNKKIPKIPMTIKLRKTGEGGAALAGAHFQFQTKRSNGNWDGFEVPGVTNDYVSGSNGEFTLPQSVLDAVSQYGGDGNNQSFRFVETQAPSGYQTPNGSNQFITAEKVITSNTQGEQLFTLTNKRAIVQSSYTLVTNFTPNQTFNVGTSQPSNATIKSWYDNQVRIYQNGQPLELLSPNDYDITLGNTWNSSTAGNFLYTVRITYKGSRYQLETNPINKTAHINFVQPTADMKLTLNKTDASTGAALSGAKFVIQGLGTDGNWKNWAAEYTTNGSGQIVITDQTLLNLLLSNQGSSVNTKYRFREITAPNGYEQPPAFPGSGSESTTSAAAFATEFKITKNQATTVSLTNKKLAVSPLKIVLNKTGDGGKPLAGATFQLESFTGQNTWKHFTAGGEPSQWKTDSQGQITLNDSYINAIKYWGSQGNDRAFRFREIEAPNGYKQPTSQDDPAFITSSKVLTETSTGTQIYTLSNQLIPSPTLTLSASPISQTYPQGTAQPSSAELKTWVTNVYLNEGSTSSPVASSNYSVTLVSPTTVNTSASAAGTTKNYQVRVQTTSGGKTYTTNVTVPVTITGPAVYQLTGLPNGTKTFVQGSTPTLTQTELNSWVRGVTLTVVSGGGAIPGPPISVRYNVSYLSPSKLDTSTVGNFTYTVKITATYEGITYTKNVQVPVSITPRIEPISLEVIVRNQNGEAMPFQTGAKPFELLAKGGSWSNSSVVNAINPSVVTFPQNTISTQNFYQLKQVQTVNEDYNTWKNGQPTAEFGVFAQGVYYNGTYYTINRDQVITGEGLTLNYNSSTKKLTIYVVNQELPTGDFIWDVKDNLDFGTATVPVQTELQMNRSDPNWGIQVDDSRRDNLRQRWAITATVTKDFTQDKSILSNVLMFKQTSASSTQQMIKGQAVELYNSGPNPAKFNNMITWANDAGFFLKITPEQSRTINNGGYNAEILFSLNDTL
ncbi:SpaA isopeptide-forming pilin-related protein [Enterococcus ureasiticus]|uniref:SpaA-like prealbumin fold domain-containing protein n=1 Tax=Enterococcus ureasiticus TaxID=903984 RepID=A0A1E5GNL7_9ENTE|nr:hypothetical protein [Enterococcus ureasiticus]OEG14287.1 hypothetical protein BCR21_04660 [Enterococcus ureasiticus]